MDYCTNLPCCTFVRHWNNTGGCFVLLTILFGYFDMSRTIINRTTSAVMTLPLYFYNGKYYHMFYLFYSFPCGHLKLYNTIDGINSHIIIMCMVKKTKYFFFLNKYSPTIEIMRCKKRIRFDKSDSDWWWQCYDIAIL